jgi:hypothetical protein
MSTVLYRQGEMETVSTTCIYVAVRKSEGELSTVNVRVVGCVCIRAAIYYFVYL